MIRAIWLVIIAQLLPVQARKLTSELEDMILSSEPATKHQIVVSLEPSMLDNTKAEPAAISALQTRVLESFSPDYVRKYKHLNGFSAYATDVEIRKLEQIPEVSLVGMMPVLKKNDLESHPLTGVDIVHSDLGVTGNGTVVAVLDDALDTSHPAFLGKVVAGFDFGDHDDDFGLDPECAIEDQSHGTGVTGIVAGNGALDVVGVAPDADIVFLKLSSRDACGTVAGDVAEAIDWLLDYRLVNNSQLDVINMSLGFGEFTAVCDELDPMNVLLSPGFRQLKEAGVTVFSSSGNGALCSALSSPACIESVVSVGATYDYTEPFDFFLHCLSASSCLPKTFAENCPSLFRALLPTFPIVDTVAQYSNSAPFLDILAPAHCGNTSAPNNETFSCFAGTSSSSPFAAGVGLLLLEASKIVNHHANASDFDLLEIMQQTGVPILDWKNGVTTPRVDALEAVLTFLPQQESSVPSGSPSTNNSMAPTRSVSTSVDPIPPSASKKSSKKTPSPDSGGTRRLRSSGPPLLLRKQQ